MGGHDGGERNDRRGQESDPYRKGCREPVGAGAGARGGARSEADGRWQVQGFAEGGYGGRRREGME